MGFISDNGWELIDLFPESTLPIFGKGINRFREKYRGEIGIQTMILSPWDTLAKVEYIALIKLLMPTEIQLNTPTRPKPLERQLDGRGNHSEERDYETRQLKCVSEDILAKFADEIYKNTKVPVRYKQVAGE
jgi:wyosine [tRNA(Phe)-imidazoG37] synthetase (radical SAM superfamily)